MLDCSLARKLAGIAHFHVYGKNFKVTPELIRAGRSDWWDNRKEAMNIDFLTRINSNSTQASELTWKFQQLVWFGDVVLVDTKLLDTAIGQYIISVCMGTNPAWAVGVDAGTSPIAPAFLRGILYPSTADDLVKVILETFNATSTISR